MYWTTKSASDRDPAPARGARRGAAGGTIALLALVTLAIPGARPASSAAGRIEYSGRDSTGFFKMILDLETVGGAVVLDGGRIEFKDLGNPYPVQPAKGKKVPRNLTNKQFAGDIVFAPANLGAAATLFEGTLTGDLGRGPIKVKGVRFPYRGRTYDLEFDLAPPGGVVTTGTGSAGGTGTTGNPKPAPAGGTWSFDNTNTDAVLNGPPRTKTVIVLARTTTITWLTTYHWNNGRGVTPGTIALQTLGNGKSYGPWHATGTTGSNNAANVNWEAKPNVTLPPGMYIVVDSDPNTWSQNRQSKEEGFARATGHY